MSASHDEAEGVADAELRQQVFEVEKRVRSVTQAPEFAEQLVVVEPHQVLDIVNMYELIWHPPCKLGTRTREFFVYQTFESILANKE